MTKCPVCEKNITFINKPAFGLGKINNQETICSNCLLQLKEIDNLAVSKLKNYSADNIKQIIADRTAIIGKISQEISELKIEPNYLSIAKKELAELPNIISQEESIFAIVIGIYNSGNGILVATDKRLLFLYKSLLGLKIEDFGFDKISSIQYDAGLLLADIKIMASGNLATITYVSKDKARDFCNKVRSKLSQPKVNNISIAQTSISVIDQLGKLAILKEQGFLTLEEFESQKKKLFSQ